MSHSPKPNSYGELVKYAAGIRAGDRASLARAITLIESKRADHRTDAHRLVQELLPATGKAIRLGITGAPGTGKSTTSGTLGGVAAKTRETMLLCEAAGYDVVIVETVGVGQSETAVSDMTDFFLLL